GGLCALGKSRPGRTAALFDVFRAGTRTEAIDRLVLATGWERSVVEAFLGPGGMAVDSAAALRPPVEPGAEPLILRLARAVDVQRRGGAAPGAPYTRADTRPHAPRGAPIVPQR